MQILNFSLRKRKPKCNFHDFWFWEPPGRAPELETPIKLASYLRFTIHSCRKALLFRAAARFWKLCISQVPGGVRPENTIEYNEIRTLKSQYIFCPQRPKSELQRKDSFDDLFIDTQRLSGKRSSALESQTQFFKTMHISLGVSSKIGKTRLEE